MKSKSITLSFTTAFIATATLPCAYAELPTLEEKPWYGYYAGYQGKKADFGLDTDGEAIIIPLAKDKKQMTTQYYLKLAYQVVEKTPDGKSVVKKFDVDSITSDTPATAKPGNIVFKGKLEEGGATFEGYFDVVRGSVMVGGRVVDKGTISNPLSFSVKVVVPTAYANAKKVDDEKTFKMKISEDEVQMKLLDGKKAKASAEDPFDEALQAASAGVNQIEFSIGELAGNTFIFTASAGSKIMVSNTKGQPFYDGLTLTWESDAAADAAKTRMAMQVE